MDTARQATSARLTASLAARDAAQAARRCRFQRGLARPVPCRSSTSTAKRPHRACAPARGPATRPSASTMPGAADRRPDLLAAAASGSEPLAVAPEQQRVAGRDQPHALRGRRVRRARARSSLQQDGGTPSTVHLGRLDAVPERLARARCPRPAHCVKCWRVEGPYAAR